MYVEMAMAKKKLVLLQINSLVFVILGDSAKDCL